MQFSLSLTYFWMTEGAGGIAQQVVKERRRCVRACWLGTPAGWALAWAPDKQQGARRNPSLLKHTCPHGGQKQGNPRGVLGEGAEFG